MMFAKYRNKIVKVLSKTYDDCYLILINNPTEEEKYLTFTIRDVLEHYGSVEDWKKTYDSKIIFDLKEGEFYKWVNQEIVFPSLVMETE